MQVILKIYKRRKDVPKVYHKHLRKMHLANGEIHLVFFNDWDEIHDIYIVVNGNNIPMAWGLMIKGTAYDYKCAMFFTKPYYRRMGLAAMIYKAMRRDHKRFKVFVSGRNYDFFQKMRRKRK